MSQALPRGGARQASPLLRALAARRELATRELVAMVLPPYAALDAIHRGRGSFELMCLLGEYAVFSELLAVRGHVAECHDAVQRAQSVLGDLGAHGAASQWRLSAQDYETIKSWLPHYVTQLGHAGLDGILSAHAELRSFIAKRSDELKLAA